MTRVTARARQTLGRRVELVPMTPLEQLRAGRFWRRFVQLNVGLVLFGISMAGMVRAGLGLEPWGVFHYGLTKVIPLPYGVMSIVVSFVVLLLWIPLRQWPGLGTVLNSIVIGVVIDLTLAATPPISSMWVRVVALVCSVVGNGVAASLYIGSQFGPGPRDGLMTGLSRRTGRTIRLVRTGIELVVVAMGWALGGVIGIGTIVYALGIGPVVHFMLPLVTVALPERADGAGSVAEGAGSGHRTPPAGPEEGGPEDGAEGT